MKTLPFFFFLLTLVPLCAQETKDTFSYEIKRDISYLKAEDIVVDSLQRLNLVLPQGVDNPPLLMWVGGGAWSFTDRNVEMDLAKKIARKGIAVATIGHRLSSGKFHPSGREEGETHPTHVQDVAAAFSFLYHNAKDYGYAADNIFVGGYSSGAHLAALLAMDGQYLNEYNLKTEDIRAVMPVAGTYDIEHYHAAFRDSPRERSQKMAVTHVKDVFGHDEAGFAPASPTSYVEQLSIPMLLISETGTYNYTKQFEDKLRETEYRDCEIFHVWSLDHGGLWEDMSYQEDSQTRKVMVDFIRRRASDS